MWSIVPTENLTNEYKISKSIKYILIMNMSKCGVVFIYIKNNGNVKIHIFPLRKLSNIHVYFFKRKWIPIRKKQWSMFQERHLIRQCVWDTCLKVQVFSRAARDMSVALHPRCIWMWQFLHSRRLQDYGFKEAVKHFSDTLFSWWCFLLPWTTYKKCSSCRNSNI